MAGAAACCWAKLRPNRSAFQTQKKKQEQSKKLLFGNLRKIWGTLGIFFMTRVKQKGGREEGEGGWHQFQLCNVFASSLSPQSSHTDKHTQRLTKSYICIQNVIKSGGAVNTEDVQPLCCAVRSHLIDVCTTFHFSLYFFRQQHKPLKPSYYSCILPNWIFHTVLDCSLKPLQQFKEQSNEMKTHTHALYWYLEKAQLRMH